MFAPIRLLFFLFVLLLMLPAVLFALGNTIVVFLNSAQQAFAAAGVLASYASHVPNSVP